MEIHKFDPSDPEGVQWFKGWLERNHYKNIQIPTNPYSPYDIEADKDSKHYIFELKNRPCTSYAFNDSIIELQKFNIIRWYDGEIQIQEDEDGKLVWVCPNCGNTDQSKMNVARRTCGYIGTQYWNQGRTQEIKDRVLHL